MNKNLKFKVMGESGIEKFTPQFNFVCQSDKPADEIFAHICKIGRDNIERLDIGNDLFRSVVLSTHHDTSAVIPELSKHDFIGHFSRITTFCPDDIDSHAYRFVMRPRK